MDVVVDESIVGDFLLLMRATTVNDLWAYKDVRRPNGKPTRAQREPLAALVGKTI
jgi:hypothetical protein